MVSAILGQIQPTLKGVLAYYLLLNQLFGVVKKCSFLSCWCKNTAREGNKMLIFARFIFRSCLHEKGLFFAENSWTKLIGKLDHFILKKFV